MQVYVEFVVHKMSLRHVFLQVLRFSPANRHSTSGPDPSANTGCYNKPILGRSTKCLTTCLPI